MRSIDKRGTPGLLNDWKREMLASPQNLRYESLPTSVKDAVKLELLTEQGYLCAYTLRRIDGVNSCHIEHVEPQNAAPGKDLDYANMAACFPKDGGDVSSGYGAPTKAGQSVTFNVDFVSPHSSGCNVRFRFDADGGICAVTGDAAAQKTIELLRLDHDALADLRRGAIQAHGLAVSVRTTRTARKLKTAAEARRFAAEVLLHDGAGRFEPYSVALAQAALTYASREDARALRLRNQHGNKFD